MPQLEVECWWGRESLSGGFEYVIDLVSPDARLGQSRFLGKALALEVRLADGSTFKRHGYVRWAATLDADGGFGRYRLIVIPWLWLTSRGRHHRVFQERTVVDIVDTVFADYADIAAWQWADEVAGFLADTPAAQLLRAVQRIRLPVRLPPACRRRPGLAHRSR